MDIQTIESRFQATDDRKCAIGEKGMVASAFPEATAAGVAMLRQGGNAIDAACATAFALGVCEPQSSGIGGQSMAIVHCAGRTFAVDGSTRVPSLGHLERFDKGQRFVGYRATTVPSTVAVLAHLNFRYGKLKWPQILEPAIRLAQEGYRITALQNWLQNRELKKFMRVPSRSGARYFLKDGKIPYEPGDLFLQSDLGWTLNTLAEQGPRAFYQGMIASRIDEDMRAHDGFLRAEDLALIPWPVERKAIKRKYRRQLTVATIPPPAAGRTLLLVLMMLDHLSSEFIQQESPESYHFIAETFRKAFLYRKQRPYDPNTYPQITDKKMTQRQFAGEQAQSIRERIDANLPFADPPGEGGDTTHLSVMDHEGNAVGITQSIELSYGAKAAADGLGFMYNNYMGALETKDPSHPHYLRPNAVPWTSVAPAIVFRKNKPWLVTGSPGSERIYSTVSQFLMQMVDRSVSMGEAMTRPRMHCSIGGKISLEAERFDPAVVAYLREMGYKIDEREAYAFYLGAIHAVMHCQTQQAFHGVAEIRRDGVAGGL